MILRAANGHVFWHVGHFGERSDATARGGIATSPERSDATFGLEGLRVVSAG